MAIKEARQTLTASGCPSPADTRAADGGRKSLQTRGLLPLPPGHRWPRAWPGQQGAIGGPQAAIPEPPASPLGRPLGLGQVARLIGCSPWTVRQTLMPRGLPYFRSGASGRLIFYQDQIIRWICQQQVKGGKQIR